MLTTDQRAILAFEVVDPDAWYANAAEVYGSDFADGAAAEKVEKLRPAYNAAQGSSYKTRVQRDAITTAAAIPTLSEKQETAKKIVDTQAENCRLLFITPGAGQTLTYQRKLEEARTFNEIGAGPVGTYPLLEASVGIEGDTVVKVASLVISTSTQWGMIAASIEHIRLGAKRDIDEATNAAAIDAVIVSLSWPSP